MRKSSKTDKYPAPSNESFVFQQNNKKKKKKKNVQLLAKRKRIKNQKSPKKMIIKGENSNQVTKQRKIRLISPLSVSPSLHIP